MASSETPSWGELVGLMVFGPGVEATVRGRIRSQDGADETRGYSGWFHPKGDPHPVFAGSGTAPQAQSDGALLVWRHGSRVRIEESDGSLNLIVGDSATWSFDRAHAEPLMTPSSAVRYGYRGTELLHRPALERFAGTDFTRPTGPVGGTTFLGRPAWTVELAPPSHKPYPIQLVVDAETGLLLQQRNDGFATVDEWVEIVTGETFDESFFRWDGEVRDWQDEQATEHATQLLEHEADMAARRAWAEQNVLSGPLRIEAELDLQIHVYDETGAFEASLGASGQGLLARRPRSDDPWELGWRVVGHRWSDDRWDWAFSAGDDPLAPGAFDAVRSQLDF